MMVVVVVVVAAAAAAAAAVAAVLRVAGRVGVVEEERWRRGLRVAAAVGTAAMGLRVAMSEMLTAAEAGVKSRLLWHRGATRSRRGKAARGSLRRGRRRRETG